MNQPLILLRDIHVALTRKSSAEHDAEALEIAQKRYRRTLSKAFGEADFFVYKPTKAPFFLFGGLCCQIY